MCFYCGCRDIPLIRDLIAEHERITDLGADLTNAMHGNLTRAGRLVAEVAAELDTHWCGEEEGLFTVLRDDGMYSDYIDDLVTEHRELRDLLATADLTEPEDRERIIAAMEALTPHIAKEEDGLFPPH